MSIRALFHWLALSVALVVGPAHAGASLVAAPPEDFTAARLLPPPAVPDGWQVEQGTWTTVYAAAADVHVARRMASHADQTIPELARALGVGAGDRIRIYVAPDHDTFRTLQPTVPPTWADGTAWPHRGLIFLRSPRIRPGTAPSLEQVLDHELVHVLLGRAFGARPVPRWLQEGAAQLFSGQYGPDTTRTLASGLLGDSLIPLRSLATGFPADPVRARLAYAESADVLAYLREAYGSQALHVLVRDLAIGRSFDAAVRDATGLLPEQIDQRWQARLHRSPIWLEPLTRDSAFWAIGAVLFVVALVKIRRRNKATLARWAREEALNDALARQMMGEDPLAPQP